MCRRLAALENAQSQSQSQRRPQHSTDPQTVSSHSPAKQKGLSKKDAAIAERLQKLKDANRPGLTQYCVVAAVASSLALFNLFIMCEAYFHCRTVLSTLTQSPHMHVTAENTATHVACVTHCVL